MSIPKVTGQSSGHRPPWMENTLLSINLVKEEHLFKGCKHEKDKRFLRCIQRAAIFAVWSLISNRSGTETWEHIRPQWMTHTNLQMYSTLWDEEVKNVTKSPQREVGKMEVAWIRALSSQRHVFFRRSLYFNCWCFISSVWLDGATLLGLWICGRVFDLKYMHSLIK